jgi:glutathione S-transferase
MIKVYASGDTRSRRVLWACEEVGAPYEIVELKFPPRLHHPEFLERSPAGSVPYIEDGATRLIESLAICEYVSRRHGGRLHVEPSEPDYYRYLQFVQFGDATLSPPLAWARRFGRFSDEVVREARTFFALRLAVLDQELADGREFLVAERQTVADISAGFTLGFSRALGLADLHPPRVAAYDGRLQARPAYQRAYAR